MKKEIKNKGFTLVELLAVIVILAIVLVIAVPKVMSVIEDSKKATLESTAKMIASGAEKQKVQNTVLGKTEKITCDSVAKINKGDYANCSIEFDNNTARVTIEGDGKFDGLWVCDGTKISAIAQKDGCSSPLEVKHPLFLAGQELTPDMFEVTLTESDGSTKKMWGGGAIVDDSQAITIMSPNWPETCTMMGEEKYWEYTFDGAEQVQITFDETSEIDDFSNDYIRIYNEDGIKLYEMTGKDFAGQTYIISGSYIKVLMYADYFPGNKGFSAEIKPAYNVDAEYTVSPSVAPSINGNFDITITINEQELSKKIIASAGKYDMNQYIMNLETNETFLNNGLVQTEVTYNEKKYNAGIRYVGAMVDVNNKVYYNCEATDSNSVAYGADKYNYESSCEVWRIIGVFDTKTSTTGNAVKRVKIINTASTFAASWDSSAKTINNGYGVNEWSQADLKNMLNGYYIGKENSTCTYCNGSEQETCSQTCNIEGATLSSENMKPLTSIAKSMIENALWDTYAVDETSNVSTNSSLFLKEKGISAQYTGISECSSCSDEVKRTTSWTGLVGLMSASDARYADGWLYNTNINSFTITPYSSNLTYAGAFTVCSEKTRIGHCWSFSQYYVNPVVYLKHNIKIISGNGDTEPYILAI